MTSLRREDAPEESSEARVLVLQAASRNATFVEAVLI
jgi:hypothetical protein